METPPVIQKWKVLKSEYAMKTPWLNVRRDMCELPDGSVIDDYYVVERTDVVSIIGITEDHQIVMNYQYKHGIGEVVYEIPSGMIDEGETPEAAARRELQEETGYRVEGECVHLADMITSPSSESNRFSIFLAPHVVPGGKKMDHPRETIINQLLPVKQIAARIQDGSINNVWSVSALHHVLTYLYQHQPELFRDHE